MKANNSANLKAFEEAEPVFARFAQSKGSVTTIFKGLTDYEKSLPEMVSWLLENFGHVDKQDTAEVDQMFEDLILSAVVEYGYRGRKVLFKLRSTYSSENSCTEEPLSLEVVSEIPDVGGLLLTYSLPKKPKLLDLNPQINPKLNHWLFRSFMPKPFQDSLDSLNGKKIPALVERNFARHNYLLMCNNESWGAKFAESVQLRTIIPVIPELTQFHIGFGSFRTLNAAPCFQAHVEGKLRRLAIYEECSRLVETCLDILISSAP